MRARVVGGATVLSLFFFGFVAAAHADSITPAATTTLGPNHDVVPDGGSWMGGRDFLATYTVRNDPGQYEGEWDFEGANPFRTLAADRSFDEVGMDAGRAFFASQHAAPNQSAQLTFFVHQTGDHDADDSDDFRLSLSNAKLLGPVGSSLGSSMGSGQVSFDSAGQSIPTPEPASLVLLGTGLAGFAAFQVRRRKKASATPEL